MKKLYLIIASVLITIQAFGMGPATSGSVRELVAQGIINPSLAVQRKQDGITLDLRNLIISNLDGIQNLVNIEDYTNIKTIMLNQNQLNQISPAFMAFLDQLPNLEKLWLGQNQINKIPNGFLGYNSKMRVLGLADNPLISIPADFLAKNTMLNFVNLKNTPLAASQLFSLAEHVKQALNPESKELLKSFRLSASPAVAHQEELRALQEQLSKALQSIAEKDRIITQLSTQLATLAAASHAIPAQSPAAPTAAPAPPPAPMPKTAPKAPTPPRHRATISPAAQAAGTPRIMTQSSSVLEEIRARAGGGLAAPIIRGVQNLSTERLRELQSMGMLKLKTSLTNSLSKKNSLRREIEREQNRTAKNELVRQLSEIENEISYLNQLIDQKEIEAETGSVASETESSEWID